LAHRRLFVALRVLNAIEAIADNAMTCCGPDPVAIDPMRTPSLESQLQLPDSERFRTCPEDLLVRSFTVQ